MDFPAQFDLSGLNGCNGFVLSGIDAIDESGLSASGTGDVNGAHTIRTQFKRTTI